MALLRRSVTSELTCPPSEQRRLAPLGLALDDAVGGRAVVVVGCAFASREIHPGAADCLDNFRQARKLAALQRRGGARSLLPKRAGGFFGACQRALAGTKLQFERSCLFKQCFRTCDVRVVPYTIVWAC